MILRNARLLDLSSAAVGEPCDVGVGPDGLLVPAGSLAPGAPVVDLDGRFVMPGLWDQHAHFGQWAIHRQRHQLPAFASARDCARHVADHLQTSTEEVFVGLGYRDAAWPDRVSAALLDEFTGTRPVVLVSRDMHSAWANSAALAHFGLGHPTGHLFEADAFDLEVRISEVEPALLDGWIADAAREAAERGVVGITELEMADNPLLWVERVARGITGLRVRASVWLPHLEAAIERGHATGEVLDEFGLVTMGPLKIIADGSLGSRTAWCFEPYAKPHPEHPRGALNITRDALVEGMARATAAGIDVAVHAIGDATVDLVLAAFEDTGARGSIEHAQLVRAADVSRMAALGVTASVQPSHLAADLSPVQRQWADRADRVLPLAELARAGVPLALGSDAPIAPLEPWQAIADAFLRERDGRPAWHPEQALTRQQALLASTNRVARLTTGAPADLCVLDANPVDVDPADLPRTRSALTMVAGRVTHRALG